jgi:hypothetical protein
MPNKLTFEHVKEFINKEQLLISTIYLNSKSLLDIQCNICKESYKQNFERYKSGHRHQKCSNKINSTKSYNKRWGNKTLLKHNIRICEWCKKEYNPKRTEQKLCSRECSQFFINKDKEVVFLRGQKGGNNSMLTLNRRSKAEIYFSKLCIEYFSNPAITCNDQFFIDKNGGKWDADIIIHHLKIAILYNGIFHYKKVYKDQKLERMIVKDRLKEKIIIANGYTYYIVKDMGSFNKEFVQEQFYLFIHKLHFKNVLSQIQSHRKNK